MTAELKSKIQLLLIVAIAVSGARAGYVVYQRHAEKVKEAKKEAPPLNPDYYVVVKKLYPHDLKSARELTQQPVWVKEGYRFSYYPYDPANHRLEMSHAAGMLSRGEYGPGSYRRDSMPAWLRSQMSQSCRLVTSQKSPA